jgi:S-adenosylmethionine:tRNA ribosyltransferase-isomerase
VSASDFDFELPEDRIAQTPAAERAASRLLHLPREGDPVHRRFHDFPGLLRRGDVLVLNETQVVPARLELRRASGGAVEVFLVREEAGGWRALLRPAKRIRAGEILEGPGGDFSVRVLECAGGEARVDFPDLPADEVMTRWGRVPLPPYVRRDPTDEDRIRYQTVYARVAGAVAAPTAGLHFDEAVLREIEARGVVIARLVLHVGPGTFRPLPEGDLGRHRLDAERYAIPETAWAAVKRARDAGGRVVAVGTTVVRALETAAANGELEGATELFVRPPFDFRCVEALLTNFHLPKSSLLCLVAAFSGRERILAAYRDAVEQRYRFYSYGDVTFLER